MKREKDNPLLPLHIDPDSELGLAVQLKREFTEYFSTLPGNTKLMPERQIATILGLARGTVRAVLQEFVSEGVLVRKGRKGTFTVCPEKDSVSIRSIYGINGIFSCAMPPLKIMLMENIPEQRLFWEATASRFTRVHPEIRIEFVWIPHVISGVEYYDFLLQNGPDIVHYVHSGIDSLLAPCSEALKKMLSTPDFRKDSVNHVLLVPVKNSAPFIFWNKDMARQLNLQNISERIKRGDKLDLYREAAPKLPEGVTVAGHIWDCFALQGEPIEESDFGENFLCKRFREFASCQGKNNLFILTQKYGREAVDLFRERKQLFFEGFPGHLYYEGRDLSFETASTFLQIDDECHLPAATLCLGVYKNSPNKQIAFKFIEFMLSEEVQNRIVDELGDIAVRISSNHRYCSILEKTAKADVDHFLRKCPQQLFTSDGFSWRLREFLIFNIRDLLYAFMHQQLPLDHIVQIARQRWDQFCLTTAPETMRFPKKSEKEEKATAKNFVHII